MQRSRAEGGAKWDWQTGGGSPWLTIFGPGDCTNLQSKCRGDNVDRALKLNVSDGRHVRISFEVLDNTDTVSQIVFPVSWGIREGYSSAHSYSKITGRTFSQHLCNPGEVMNRSSSTPACTSRVITTHNLGGCGEW